jgi:hypothetical protein
MDTAVSAVPENPSSKRPGESIFQRDSTQVAIMAGVVTMVSQPFAQIELQNSLGLPPHVPIYIAIAVSVLLAAYQVFGVQRARMGEGLCMAPLVALIVFSSYVGTNHVVASQKPPLETTEQKLGQARLDNLQKELDLQKHINSQLMKSIGLPADDDMQGYRHGGTTPGPQSRATLRDWIERALGILVSPAYGQSDKATRVAAEERRLAEQVRLARMRQKQLELERQRLEQAARKTPNQQTRLLRSW